MAQWAKNSPANAGDALLIPDGEDPLEEGMATHSSILAWRTPCTEEPGRLQSLGLKESDTTEATEYTQTWENPAL